MRCTRDVGLVSALSGFLLMMLMSIAIRIAFEFVIALLMNIIIPHSGLFGYLPNIDIK